jgi:hypothetical protein
VSIKVDSGGQVSPGNFGALDLKDAPDCKSSNGASNHRDMIGRTAHSCGLVVGDTVDTETGNMAGPTSQGLDDRGVINNFDPNTLITSDGHGGQTVTDWNHPNLMVIPIIQAWSNGHASVTIVGFQYFIITSYTSKTISGMFVHLTGTAADWSCPTAQDPNASCPLGNYNPTSGPTVIRPREARLATSLARRTPWPPPLAERAEMRSESGRLAGRTREWAEQGSNLRPWD